MGEGEPWGSGPRLGSSLGVGRNGFEPPQAEEGLEVMSLTYWEDALTKRLGLSGTLDSSPGPSGLQQILGKS